MEVAIDMVADAAGRDPVELRLDLLSGGGEERERLLGVLRLAAEKAGWGRSLPDDHFRGVALHKSFGSYVAQVVEVSVADGAVKIE